MSDMDKQIRAARGQTVGGSTGAEIDAAIRRATGRGPVTGQQQEGNDQATPEQLQAARSARLPDRFAHRLQGEDLHADARSFAGVIAAAGVDLVPEGSGFDGGARTARVERGRSMDDQIRTALDNRNLFGNSLPLDGNLSHLHTDR